LQTVESVAVALHSLLAEFNFNVFNILLTILKAVYYPCVAAAPFLQKIKNTIYQLVTYWCAFCNPMYVDELLIKFVKWRGKHDET